MSQTQKGLTERENHGDKVIKVTTHTFDDGSYIKISEITNGNGEGRMWANMYLGDENDCNHTIRIQIGNVLVAEIKIDTENMVSN